MAMFHMPHDQSFGYLYPIRTNLLVGETLRSRTPGGKLPCSTCRNAETEQFVNRGVGVGRGNGRSCCWVRTPPRKIRAQFQACKHTSLNQDASNLRQVYHASILGALQSVGRG